MAKRIYDSRVKKYLIGSGVAVPIIIGVFWYLASINAITITGYSGDMVCAGTEADPCYAYINFTANTDVFLYINDTKWSLETTPVVKDIILQRKWGKGWRTIDTSKGCTGSWCGCYWCTKSKTAKYSYVFREGRNYQIRFVGYKFRPSDTIKWGFGNNYTMFPVDPVWLGVASKFNITIYSPDNLTYSVKTLDFNWTINKSIAEWVAISVNGKPNITYMYNTTHFDTAGVNSPAGIVLNSTASNVFLVTDGAAPKIHKYDKNGTYLGYFNTYTDNSCPIGVTANGSHIWVTDVAFVLERIYIYNSDGTYRSYFTKAADNDAAYGITTNNTHLLVTDYADAKVYVYDMNGNYLFNWNTGSDCSHPYGIEMNTNIIWITDVNSKNLCRYHLNGTFINSSDAVVFYPYDSAYDGTYLWIVDSYNDEIYRFKPNMDYGETLNITIEADVGVNTFTMWANDTIGNLYSTTFYFTVLSPTANVTHEVEYGTPVLFSTNTNYTTCLTDLYSTNCSSTQTTNLVVNAYPALYEFQNGANSKTFTSNGTVNIRFNNKSVEILDAMVNLTPTSGTPENIKIDVLNDGKIDAYLPGKLIGKGKMGLTNLNGTQQPPINITDGFGTVYLKLHPQAKILAANITLTPQRVFDTNEIAENSWYYISDPAYVSNPQYAYDGNFSSYMTYNIKPAVDCNDGSDALYENYTVSKSVSTMNITLKAYCYANAVPCPASMTTYWYIYNTNTNSWKRYWYQHCSPGTGNVGYNLTYVNITFSNPADYVDANNVVRLKTNFTACHYCTFGGIRYWYYDTSVTYDTYPENVEIDSLNDGTNESYISELSVVTTKSLNISGIESELSKHINQTYVEIPIAIYTPTNVNITIANITVNYTIHNLTLNVTAMDNWVKTNRTVPIKFNFTNGQLKVEDLFVPYQGAGNLTIFAYRLGNFSRLLNTSVEVYWSNFSVTMPEYVYFPEFIPSTNYEDIIVNVSQWNNDSEENLVAAFYFNENNGTSATGNGYGNKSFVGTYTGETLRHGLINWGSDTQNKHFGVWSEGYYSNGLYCAGKDTNNTYVYDDDFGYLHTNLTMMGWIKPVNDQYDNSPWYHVFIAGGATYGDGISIDYHDGGNRIKFYSNFNNGTNYIDASYSVYDFNKWYHIAVTLNSSGLFMYIDGTEVVKKTIVAGTTSISWLKDYKTDGYVYICGNAIGSRWLNDTYVDEIRIWNKTMTPDEIKKEMNSPYPVDGDRLIASYSFDEGTIGTQTPSSAWDRRLWTKGRYRTGLYFDGVNDYVEVINSTHWGLDKDGWTISAWFKADGIGENKKGYIYNGLRYSINCRLNVGNPVKCRCFYGNSSNSSTFTSSSFSYGTWNMLTVVYKGGPNYDFYLNGNLESSKGNGGIDRRSTDELYIGDTSLHTRSFNGTIDEVLIFNRSLTVNEIKELYLNQSVTYRKYYNVTPWGQTDMQPIFNLTALGYAKNQNITFYVNQSYDECMNITASTTNDKNDGWILNTSKHNVFTNMGWQDKGAIWLWADLNNCTSRWIEWYPEITSCCSTCYPCW